MDDYPLVRGEVHVDAADSIAVHQFALARISLSGGRCRGDVSFSEVAITQAVTFAGGDVGGSLLLQRTDCVGDATFRGSYLHGDVRFEECVFRRPLEFEGASVLGSLALADCRLHQTATFDGGTYRNGIRIDHCDLRDALQFEGCAVHGDVEVRDSALHGPARFDGSRCAGGLALIRCSLGRGASFQAGDYEGKVHLTHVTASGDVELSDVNLRDELEITRSQIDGDLDLRRGDFAGDVKVHDVGVDGLHLNELHCTAELELRDLDVRGLLDLTHGVYQGPVAVSASKAAGGISLREVRAEARVRFSGVSSAGPAVFAGGLYEDHVSLKDVTFEAEADFRSVVLLKGVTFESVVFKKSAIFADVEFGTHATFRDVTFEGPVTFSNSRAESLLLERVTFQDEAEVDASLDVASVELRRASFAGQSSLALHSCELVIRDCTFAGPSTIVGDFVGGSTPRGTRLTDVEGSDMTNLVLEDVDLRACQLSRAHNLDKLRLDSAAISLARTPTGISWGRRRPFVQAWTRRRIISEEVDHRLEGSGARQWEALGRAARGTQHVDPAQIAITYRQLRKAREDAKDEPGAADFYYGEMEMRRRNASSSRAERAVLWLYWVTCGYGLRASRALGCLVLLVVLGAVLARSHGFQATPSWPAAFVYALEATTKLTAPTRAELTLWGRLVDVSLRLGGPIFLGLAVLSVRGRTKR